MQSQMLILEFNLNGKNICIIDLYLCTTVKIWESFFCKLQQSKKDRNRMLMSTCLTMKIFVHFKNLHGSKKKRLTKKAKQRNTLVCHPKYLHLHTNKQIITKKYASSRKRKRKEVNKCRKCSIKAQHVFVHLTCVIHHKYPSVSQKSKQSREGDTPLDKLFGLSIKSRE